MTEEKRGPLYEYMMGTFDMNDQTWIAQMNSMMNSYGLAGWKRSVVTLVDARYMLVIMERKYPAPPEQEVLSEAEEFDQEADAVMAEVAEAMTNNVKRKPGRPKGAMKRPVQ